MKNNLQQLVLGSKNPGKIKEFEEIFSNSPTQIIKRADVPECDEPYGTFIENALHKARHYSKHTGLPAIADDSGLCVVTLGGAPGVYSARYAGEPKSDHKNNQKLLEQLAGHALRDAYFYCLLVLVRYENDPQPIIADGVVRGEIALTAKGNNGFGYNPIFYLPQYSATMAQLPNEVKNKISHRANAIKSLKSKLEELGNHATQY